MNLYLYSKIRTPTYLYQTVKSSDSNHNTTNIYNIYRPITYIYLYMYTCTKVNLFLCKFVLFSFSYTFLPYGGFAHAIMRKFRSIVIKPAFYYRGLLQEKISESEIHQQKRKRTPEEGEEFRDNKRFKVFETINDDVTHNDCNNSNKIAFLKPSNARISRQNPTQEREREFQEVLNEEQQFSPCTEYWQKIAFYDEGKAAPKEVTFLAKMRVPSEQTRKEYAMSQHTFEERHFLAALSVWDLPQGLTNIRDFYLIHIQSMEFLTFFMDKLSEEGMRQFETYFCVEIPYYWYVCPGYLIGLSEPFEPITYK